MKKKQQSNFSKSVSVLNKKATFNYSITKKFIAGIVLTGTEVKSIRVGGVSISEAFCYFKKNELYVKNMNISEFEMGTIHNHLPTRERKLLLNRKELNALQSKIKEKGFTIVPIRLFMGERDFIKLEIGLAVGKKLYDKRDSIKKRENNRQLDRLKKQFKI